MTKYQKALADMRILPREGKSTQLITDNIGAVDRAKSSSNEFKEGLENIDKSITPDPVKDYNLPDSLNQSKIIYDAPDDEQIRKQAEAALTEYYLNSKGDIEKRGSESTDNLKNYLQTVNKNAEEKERNVASIYEQAKSSVAGEALKRGLARSSIVLNQMEGLAKQQAESMENIRNNLLDETAQIELNISQLKTEQESALRNLDITYASKLAMQIADLADKRDQKMTEVTKYNNQIAEKEQKYIIDKLKAEQSLKLGDYNILEKDIEASTSLEGKMDEYRQKLKFEYIMDYLTGMSKAEAIKFAEQNPDIKGSLNTYYYRRLINALEAR